MWTHSAPCFIMRLISFDRSPKFDASTDGAIIARGELIRSLAERRYGGKSRS